MKKLILISSAITLIIFIALFIQDLISLLIFKSGSETLPQRQIPMSFFDFKIKNIDGQIVDFNIFKGKKAIIVVNVACGCGLTSKNYLQMNQLYKQLKDKGLMILAFPCNQFYEQQSGTQQQIKLFVQTNFQPQFPVFEKIEVNGKNTHPLYVYLKRNSSLYNKQDNTFGLIPWNFSKFVLNKNGEVIKFAHPNIEPKQLRYTILELLE